MLHAVTPVACDIVYADVPAIDDGSDIAVIFVGTDTQVTDIYMASNRINNL